MLDNAIIDVALGLIFFYVVLSLAASAIQEWIAAAVGLRSTNLNEGIKRLVGDDYAEAVYNHPMIKNLAKADDKPSYIDPKTLSTVVLDIIGREQGKPELISASAADARKVIGKIENEEIKQLLSSILGEAESTAATFKNELADWFDQGMVRISGWYKRKAKLFIIIIAVVLTVGTNASTIRIASELSTNDELRTAIAEKAVDAAKSKTLEELEKTNLDALKSFPIGWTKEGFNNLNWSQAIIGWLITVAAISLGAPFWFDLLGKVANLRGAGNKPAPRKKDNQQNGTQQQDAAP